MATTEIILEIPIEHERNVLGQLDSHLKKIERAFHITLLDRGRALKIIGAQVEAERAKKVFESLMRLSERGNQITEQNVDYAIALTVSEKSSDSLVEIDKDILARTALGKPVKPKTLGQKDYVERIRDNMLTFGIGPAGTGKTYLAMAMAITAFRRQEVSRIILTRPAIEAGEKLGFLPGDLQSKVDPYLRPLYDALYQIMGAEQYLSNVERGLIEVAPLAYMRGRTLDNAYIILDEAQDKTRADEDVSYEDRLRLQGDRDGRSDAEGSGGGEEIRAGGCDAGPPGCGGNRLRGAHECRRRPPPPGAEDRKRL